MNTIEIIQQDLVSGSPESPEASANEVNNVFDIDVSKHAIIAESTSGVVDQDIDFLGDNIYRGIFILSGNTEIQELSSAVSASDEYISDVEDVQQAYDNDLTTVRGYSQTNTNDIFSLSSDVNYINADIETLSGDVSTLESSSDDINVDIQTLSTEVSAKIDKSDEGYSISIPASSLTRVFDFNNTTIEDLYDLIGTLIQDLQVKNII